MLQIFQETAIKLHSSRLIVFLNASQIALNYVIGWFEAAL
jgi:hypothetical protein